MKLLLGMCDHAHEEDKIATTDIIKLHYGGKTPLSRSDGVSTNMSNTILNNTLFKSKRM